MTLPGPETTHGWRGRTLVDRNGEPVGSIENIYLDKVTGRAEWALLAGRSLRRPTFVPLVSASEEGETVWTPFEKMLVERAPSVPAGRDISEEQEAELYQHYGIRYSTAESPSGLPTDRAQATGRSASGAGSEPVSEATVRARPEPDDGPSPDDAGVSPSQATGASNAGAARAVARVADPRVLAAASGAALAIAAGVWRRKSIARQVDMVISGLAGFPERVGRRRRQRRRAKAFDQAVTAATQRAMAVTETTTQVLGVVSLLSIASAIQGGRRAWGVIQNAQQRVMARRGRRDSNSRRGGGRLARKFGAAIPRITAISELAPTSRTAKRAAREAWPRG